MSVNVNFQSANLILKVKTSAGLLAAKLRDTLAVNGHGDERPRGDCVYPKNNSSDIRVCVEIALKEDSVGLVL